MTDLDLIPETSIGLWKADDFTGVIHEATQAADALGAVVKDRKLTVKIQGRHHVLVEGWTLLGTMLGVQPYVVWSKPLYRGGSADGDPPDLVGWEARVEARTLDGRVIRAAEAQCTRQERTWRTRDDYALRSMAQTRAVSKALRLPLGFVMSIAGYEATPAEEMPTTNPDQGPRQTIVIGPDADPLEPAEDFGPVTDPSSRTNHRKTSSPSTNPSAPASKRPNHAKQTPTSAPSPTHNAKRSTPSCPN